MSRTENYFKIKNGLQFDDGTHLSTATYNITDGVHTHQFNLNDTLQLTAGDNTAISVNASTGVISISSSNPGGTVTSVSALTLGTSGTDINSSVETGTTTPVITLNIPTASATNRGALSSTDWSTFNGKQSALVSGTSIKTINSSSLLGSGNLSVGTVTSVGGTGTVNGLTLTGSVTSSGSLTLGGTLSLVSPPAIGSSTPNTGAFTTLSASGVTTLTGEVLINNAGGSGGSSEGGELHFAVPASGSSLSGPVAIDIYQNKIRFFETTGSLRGAYIDLTTANSSVGSNLLSGATSIASSLNYAQAGGGSRVSIATNASFPASIVSVTITTQGGPVLINAYGDAENSGTGYWGTLQLYRGTTAIGSIVHHEGSAGSENSPFSLNYIDNPSAGTYTYYLKANAVSGGTINYGESTAPTINVTELRGIKGDTGATGAAGSSGNNIIQIAYNYGPYFSSASPYNNTSSATLLSSGGVSGVSVTNSTIVLPAGTYVMQIPWTVEQNTTNHTWGLYDVTNSQWLWDLSAAGSMTINGSSCGFHGQPMFTWTQAGSVTYSIRGQGAGNWGLMPGQTSAGPNGTLSIKYLVNITKTA